MAFKYNGTSPTAIKYNGTDLTVLKYGNTAVWGKPYSLSISAGSNTTVTVNRTSSPNQHASTGTLSSGSVIYYGDVLTISYSVSSGYAIGTHTVNGTTFTSGQSFTVTSAISVVTTAQASASWKTIFSGNKEVSSKQANAYTGTICGGCTPNAPTRITGTIMLLGDPGAIGNFTSLDLPKTWTNGSDSAGACHVSIPTSQYLYATCHSVPMNIMGTLVYQNTTITITKVEQYY